MPHLKKIKVYIWLLLLNQYDIYPEILDQNKWKGIYTVKTDVTKSTYCMYEEDCHVFSSLFLWSIPSMLVN